MDERFITVLQKIKETYGEDVFQSLQKTRGLLLDLAPEQKKETYLFLNLLRASGFKEVKQSDATAFYRLLDVMESLYSVKKSAAVWAINALSGLLNGKLFDFGNTEADEPDLFSPPIAQTENSVALGSSHTIAVTEDGDVLSAGENEQGQCDVHSFSNVVSVYACDNYSAALTGDGKVLTVGDCSDFNTSDWGNIKRIIPTAHRIFALDNDGQLLASGKNTEEFLDKDKWGNLVFAAASTTLAAAIKNTGKVVISDARINVSHWRDIQSIGLSNSHIVGLRRDGHVLAVGRNNFSQCAVESWRDIVQISVGESDTPIIEMAKDAFEAALQEIGDIFADDTMVKRRLERLNVIKAELARDYDSLENASAAAIERLGEEARGFFITINSRDNGLAAKFRHTFMSMKKCIDELERYDGYSACHTVGLRADGTVITTGFNGMGQCDTDDFASVRRVITSGQHTIGLRYNKTIAITGANQFNQLYAETWDNIDDVYPARSGDYIVGLKSDRRLCSVGNDNRGQCNIDTWRSIGRSERNE